MFIHTELLWGDTGLNILSLSSVPQTTGNWKFLLARRKRDYAEGANPYFLVKGIAKRLRGL